MTGPAAEPVIEERGRAFASLRIPSFRWWFFAQILSGSGGMAAIVGQAWLVLHVLHGGGLALGIVSSAAFTPVLLGSAWAGAVLARTNVRLAVVPEHVGSVHPGRLGG